MDSRNESHSSEPAQKKAKLSLSARSQGDKGWRWNKMPQGIRGASAQHERAESALTVGMVKDLAQLVDILVRDKAKSNPGLTQEIEDRIKCVRRTIEREPGQLLEKTLQDLHSADAAKRDLRVLVRDFRGHREFHKDNEFPRVTDSKELAKSWKAIREHVKEAFEDSILPAALSRKISIRYVATRMDDLTQVPRAQGLGTIPSFLKDLALHLKNPHLVRAIMGALLCCWLFSTPEPMCQNVYSQKRSSYMRP